MSITDWINQTVHGGVDSPLGQLLEVAYTIEYGAECDVQSALNLIYLLGYNSPGQFTVFDQSNEKYHVRGGNDQIVSRLADLLGSQLLTGQALVALRRNADGTYRLTFQISDQFGDVTADHVVLALPFSILNNSVDLTEAGFSELKMIAIQELAMGSNSKLNLQFDSRPWAALRCNGETYSDAVIKRHGKYRARKAETPVFSFIIQAARWRILSATAPPRSTLRSSSPRLSRCDPG
jgi:monoamine oxidase